MPYDESTKQTQSKTLEFIVTHIFQNENIEKK